MLRLCEKEEREKKIFTKIFNLIEKRMCIGSSNGRCRQGERSAAGSPRVRSLQACIVRSDLGLEEADPAENRHSSFSPVSVRSLSLHFQFHCLIWWKHSILCVILYCSPARTTHDVPTADKPEIDALAASAIVPRPASPR